MTDLLVYVAMLAFFAGGFIIGRLERRDAQVKIYKKGKAVGMALARAGRNER